MAVLTAVDVGVANQVRIIVRDRQMSVIAIVLVDIIVDRVVVGTQNHCLVTFLGDLFVYVLEILSHQKLHSSVGATDECHDWRLV